MAPFGGLPAHVEVAGGSVRIKTGFRSAILSHSIDTRDGGVRLAALFFGGPRCDFREVPAVVWANLPQALEAAIEWRDGAWDTVSYGPPARPSGSRRRLMDWEEDAGIISADFQRLYGIDLDSPATQLHWWRFTALLLSAARTPGSLLGAAISARSPQPRAKGEAAKRQRELRRMWALGPTEREQMAAACAAFEM